MCVCVCVCACMCVLRRVQLLCVWLFAWPQFRHSCADSNPLGELSALNELNQWKSLMPHLSRKHPFRLLFMLKLLTKTGENCWGKISTLDSNDHVSFGWIYITKLLKFVQMLEVYSSQLQLKYVRTMLSQSPFTFFFFLLT